MVYKTGLGLVSLVYDVDEVQPGLVVGGPLQRGFIYYCVQGGGALPSNASEDGIMKVYYRVFHKNGTFGFLAHPVLACLHYYVPFLI